MHAQKNETQGPRKPALKREVRREFSARSVAAVALSIVCAAVSVLSAESSASESVDFATTEAPRDVDSAESSRGEAAADPASVVASEFEPAWDLFGLDKPVVPFVRKIRAPEPFPFLPGETLEGSVSTGTVTDGAIYQSAELPNDHPDLTILPRQQSRGLRYGSSAMIAAIVRAAEEVARRYPGSVLGVGNIGRIYGGDIPWSVSHNSGLDADFAFYARTADGEYAVLPDLLSFDSDSTCEQNGNTWYFDAERNWVFIRELLLNSEIVVQRLFISDPLRDELLTFARSAREPAELLSRASEVLSQPGAAIPHDDHLHLRIHCSPRDVAGGCARVGPLRQGASDYYEALTNIRGSATAALESRDSTVRASAIRRLAMIGPPAEARPKLVSLIGDEAEDVRLQAVIAATQLSLTASSRRMEERLEVERSTAVRRELVGGLITLRSENVWQIVDDLLQTPQLVEDGGKVWDFRLSVIDALAESTSVRAVEALLNAPYWRSDCRGGMELRYRSAQALSQITNTGHAEVRVARFDMRSERAEPNEANSAQISVQTAEAMTVEQGAQMVAPWSEWLAVWRSRDGQRERWVLEGFRSAGFDVDQRGVALARELAIAAGVHRTYIRENAQRHLMEWSGNDVRSLEWSAEDAGVYWRRYVDRKPWRFR